MSAHTHTHLPMCLYMQHLRRGTGGLPAFRRLLGRPILREVKLQDVVFAEGRGTCTNAQAAAARASVQKLSQLDRREKQLEKQDLDSVRIGLTPDLLCLATRGQNF